MLENIRIGKFSFSAREALVFLFFFALPLGTKKFLFPLEERGITSEADGVFLFLNDIWIPILGIVLFVLIRKKALSWIFEKKIIVISLSSFLLVALFSIFVSSHTGVSIYAFARLLLGVLLGIFACTLVRHSDHHIAALGVFVSGIVQSIIGVVQFTIGKSIGIRYLGEVVVNETTQYVARTSVGDALFLRAYGTMQHANILAAFLLVAFISGLFLLVRNFMKEKRTHMTTAFLAGGLFLVASGLTLTFSRSGWIATAIALSAFVGILISSSGKKVVALKIVTALFFVAVAVYSIFGWAILPRASFEKDEPSVELRVDYLYLGKEIVKENPIVGVGIGNEIPYAKEHGLYGAFGIMRQQDYQPVHNMPLLIFSEIGFTGGIPLGIFLAVLLSYALRNMRKDVSVAWVFSILIGFFAFSLVDHFFWTMQSGIAMFWVFVFLLLALSDKHGRVKHEPS